MSGLFLFTADISFGVLQNETVHNKNTHVQISVLDVFALICAYIGGNYI